MKLLNLKISLGIHSKTFLRLLNSYPESREGYGYLYGDCEFFLDSPNVRRGFDSLEEVLVFCLNNSIDPCFIESGFYTI